VPDTPVSWRERLAAAPLVAAARSASPRLLAAGLAVGGLAVGVAVAVIALRGTPAQPELTLPRATATGPASGSLARGGGGARPSPGAGGARPTGAEASPPEPDPDAYVHAAGAVVRPGVYRVRAGGRVADVLDAAGGPAPDADLDQVNLAAKVSDGERVFVPRRGQAVPGIATGVAGGASAAAAAPSGPIDLNSATLEQLDSLPGVGPATAQAILDYRAEHGRFTQVQELLEVRGIGEAKLAALRARVRV